MDLTNNKSDKIPKGFAGLSKIVTAKWQTAPALAMAPYRTESLLSISLRGYAFLYIVYRGWADT